mgnify:CR=1 FL=1
MAKVDIDTAGSKQRKFLLLSDSLNAIKAALKQAQPRFAHSSLAEDKSLKLVIRGRVALVEPPEARSDRQRISLRFESRYIIQAEEQH